MSVTVENVSQLGRKLTIEVPAEAITKDVSERLQKLAREARLPGFRPGKVPLKVIRQRYLKPVTQETLANLMQSSLMSALEDKGIKPAAYPKVLPVDLEKYEEGQEFSYQVELDELPKIELATLTDVAFEQPQVEITDLDIHTVLERMREQNPQWKAVERACQDKDKVMMDFEGSIDGELFPGGKAEGFGLVLGSGGMIPGFEEPIIGMSKGDEKDITVTFPAEYHAKELAGKEATFKIVVHEVLEPALADLDEAFAQQFGIKEGGMDALKKDVKGNMERELKMKINTQMKEIVFTKLLEMHAFDLPVSLLVEETANMRRLLEQGAANSLKRPGLDAITEDNLEEEANRRVHLGLLIAHIIEAKGIKADMNRISERIFEMASVYEQPEQIAAWYLQNENARKEVESMVLEDQVLDWILSEAKITDKPTSYKEVMGLDEKAEK